MSRDSDPDLQSLRQEVLTLALEKSRLATELAFSSSQPCVPTASNELGYPADVEARLREVEQSFHRACRDAQQRFSNRLAAQDRRHAASCPVVADPQLVDLLDRVKEPALATEERERLEAEHAEVRHSQH